MLNQNPVIDQLLKSDVYRQIAASADAERMAAHRAALAELAAHVQDTAPQLEKARRGLGKAEAELASAAATYERARAAHAHAAWGLQSLEMSANSGRNRLALRLEEHLPSEIAALEGTLRLVELDINAAHRSKTNRESLLSGGSREVVSTNQVEIAKAKDSKEKIAQHCKSLRHEPKPGIEIIETLRDYLGELRSLARALGVEIDHRLPKLLAGQIAERLRDPKIGYAVQGHWRR